MSGGFDILQGNENKVTQTQTTDVEAELNGYFSYDRRVTRVSLHGLLRELHERLYF